MQFDLDALQVILPRTPPTLRTLLLDLPAPWIRGHEGGDSWSPFDIVGHLVHGERTDWIPRARLILERGAEQAFDPFDRFAQLRESSGKSLQDLLDEFASLRGDNLQTLRRWNVGPADLARTGRHPDFGSVTLGQLLSTWVVHDLNHIGQIARVLAKQYREEVGSWRAYLPILDVGPPA